jgi:hypothetical protein
MASETNTLKDNLRNAEPANLPALHIEDSSTTMPESPAVFTEKALEANIRPPHDSEAANNLSLRIDPPFTMTDFPGSFVRIVHEGQPSFVPRKSYTLVAYFTHGWTDAEIWKAAVRVDFTI